LSQSEADFVELRRDELQIVAASWNEP